MATASSTPSEERERHSDPNGARLFFGSVFHAWIAVKPPEKGSASVRYIHSSLKNLFSLSYFLSVSDAFPPRFPFIKAKTA